MKAAVYCRLSEEDRDKDTGDSGSIQNQKMMLTQYAKERGWELYDIYSDDDYTGADRRRPAFNRLLKDAEARRFDIILCKTQSRFTRELELVETYIHGLFPLWGIRFIGVVDHADSENRGNKKARQINGLINEWYLEDLSENIRSVLTSRRRSGYHIGSFALYGYRKDPNLRGHLLVDPEAAAVVRKVFSLFAQGYGKTAIARILNEEGIPNPTEYKRRLGLRYHQPGDRNSTLWRYPAIASMLTNETYLGNLVQGRYGSVSYKTKENRPRPKDQWFIVPGTHEAIIDRELWDLVQIRIRERASPFAGGEAGLFAGKARCAYCGYAMRSSKNRGRRYLRCGTRQVSPDTCPGAFLAEVRLEELVLGEMYRLADQFLDREALEQAVAELSGSEKKAAALRTRLEQIKQRAETRSRDIRLLYQDRLRGHISLQDFDVLSNELMDDRTRLEQEAEAIQAQLSLPREPSVNRLDACLHPEKLDRLDVSLLIDHISIGRRIPGSREVPVTIYWAF